MAIGGSLLLIVVGLILKYAVTATVAGISIQGLGSVLIIVGIVGLVVGLVLMAMARGGGGFTTGRRRRL